MSWLLPHTCKSGPGCCLISATLAATSPLRNTVGCQVLEVRVFDAMYLVAVLTPGQQIKGHVHLPADGGPDHVVGEAREPAAIGEATAGVFPGSAGGLDDAIHRDMREDDNFSHP